MHVGFALLTLFPGRVGGSESNVRGLLGEFAKGDGPGRVTVLANRHVARAYRAEGPVALHEVRSYRPGDRMATRALAMASALAFPRRAARDVPGDLDVMHYPVTVPIPRTAAPTVVTLLDVQHHDLPGFFSRPESAFRRRAYDRAAREAGTVVTISEFSRGRIAATLGIDPARIEAVPLGVDHGSFAPGGEKAELGQPERFLFYPANLWPHKNHERLLEALALAPGVELVLSGQVYGRAGWLEAKARSLGVGDRVRHIGHVPQATVAPLLRSATGLVFPSLYEGFGVPPLEAMACGCPVAASDRSALPETVGDAALLFDPDSARSIADAMTRLMDDDPLRDRLRDAGLRRSAEFTWEVAARRHRAIYARAAGHADAE